MKKIFLLNLITFLSAFLLFQIELIIAKILLPEYGGSYMVWGSCMVFFQAALLAGYYFSHALLSRLGISKYLLIHLALLFLPLLFFPGRALSTGAHTNSGFIAADIFRQLLITIGPVFFLLATMSMVTQIWLAHSGLEQKTRPHTLYAWSNLGSFAALLNYPFVFEYAWDLSSQLLFWRLGYLALIVLNIIAWLLIPAGKDELIPNELPSEMTVKHRFIRPFLLSAGGVMLFLAVTNIITVEIAPIPLIWIIPLALYLLSFVLNFKDRPWYPAWIDRYIPGMMGISVVLYFLLQQQSLPVVTGGIATLILLFFICMYCQHQLLEQKPSAPGALTAFYLFISLGGFVGGLITTWLIPLISSSLLEYPVALLIIALAFPDISEKERGKKNTALQYGILIVFILVLLVWPWRFPKSNLLIVLILLWLSLRAFTFLKSMKYAVAGILGLTIVLSSYLEMAWTGRNFIYRKRNFYGIYQVYNTGRIRRFRHGATLHGTQIMDPQYPQNQLVPTTYYGEHSPVASVLGLPDHFPAGRVGVVGLGAGTLAAYSRPGQIMDFYELDPEVHNIADNYFTYLQNARGKLNFFIGDGRLNIKNNKEVKYDVLMVDAFNGDAIPYHLITEEMMNIYRQHLNPRGILLFHLSNRYFKLEQILSRIAAELHARMSYKLGVNSGDNIEELSLWGAITWDDGANKELISSAGWTPDDPSRSAGLRPWTDQYSNVLPIVKYDEFFGSVFRW